MVTAISGWVPDTLTLNDGLSLAYLKLTGHLQQLLNHSTIIILRKLYHRLYSDTLKPFQSSLIIKGGTSK